MGNQMLIEKISVLITRVFPFGPVYAVIALYHPPFFFGMDQMQSVGAWVHYAGHGNDLSPDDFLRVWRTPGDCFGCRVTIFNHASLECLACMGFRTSG